jgi:uncharacterized membrane protein
MTANKTARALGWFSIGLGLTEAVATRQLERVLGLEKYSGLIRTFGAREIATGIGILALPDPTPGIWARVGGDALDLATLGAALASAQGKRGRLGAAFGTVAAVAAVDVLCARQLGTQGRAAATPATLEERSLSIGRPADELYRLWRDPATFATIMGSVAEVTALADGRSRWTISGPRGRTLTWETQIVDEQPGELLRWRSAPKGKVASEGRVRFRPAPGDWGTEISLHLQITPQGGLLSRAMPLALGGGSRLLLGQVLRRFKSLAETGEVPTISSQPAARNDGRDR